MSDQPRNHYKLGTVQVSEGTGIDPSGLQIWVPLWNEAHNNIMYK